MFNSGNSLVVQFPQEPGVNEGSTMLLLKECAGYHIEPEHASKRGIDVSGFWGNAPDAVPPPREDFEEWPGAVASRFHGNAA